MIASCTPYNWAERVIEVLFKKLFSFLEAENSRNWKLYKNNRNKCSIKFVTSKRKLCAETDQNFARIILIISFFNKKVKAENTVYAWKK